MKGRCGPTPLRQALRAVFAVKCASSASAQERLDTTGAISGKPPPGRTVRDVGRGLAVLRPNRLTGRCFRGAIEGEGGREYDLIERQGSRRRRCRPFAPLQLAFPFVLCRPISRRAGSRSRGQTALCRRAALRVGQERARLRRPRFRVVSCGVRAGHRRGWGLRQTDDRFRVVRRPN